MKPIFIGLGTAALLTVGGLALPMNASASDPSPSAGVEPSAGPSDSPVPTPPETTPPPPDPPPTTTPPSNPAPSLSITMSLSPTSTAAGGWVTATVTVSASNAVAHHAVLSLSATGASVISPGSLGDLGSQALPVSSVVTIPSNHGAGKVTVTASISADHATSKKVSKKITVTAATGGGTTTTPSTVSGTFPHPTVPGGIAPTATGPGGTPQLPLIGQDPAVAPQLLATGTPAVLRANSLPLGLDPTSYRLFWTQVAWLTALLVGLLLVSTQLRLNRRRLAAASNRIRVPAFTARASTKKKRDRKAKKTGA